jgi:CRISPR system Cascade subunit CasE
VQRNPDAGFLFRVDPQPGGRVVILVVSAIRPDWDYAFHNAGHLLAAKPSEPRPVEFNVDTGACFRFHLLANPTKKVETLSKEQRHAKVDKRHGRRVPVPTSELEGWLSRRAERCGFRLESIDLLQPGYVYVNKKPDRENGQCMRSARYGGILEVTCVDSFRDTLVRGIGPAKAFGFGLLSVAPVR